MSSTAEPEKADSVRNYDEQMHEETNGKNTGGGTEPTIVSNITRTTRTRIDKPLPFDIICGRGSRVTHPGNKRFRELVMEQKELYQRSTRREDKTRITMDIVHQLVGGDEPSRFLLKDPKANCWYDVGLYYAKEKVSHALRSRPVEDRRKRIKIKKSAIRKPSFSPELENVVQELIADQQSLLQTLMQNEKSPTRKGGLSSA